MLLLKYIELIKVFLSNTSWYQKAVLLLRSQILCTRRQSLPSVSMVAVVIFVVDT